MAGNLGHVCEDRFGENLNRFEEARAAGPGFTGGKARVQSGMILSTRFKILLARTVRLPIVWWRRARRRGARATVTRRGIIWALDLDEGIDLSIYLFGCFEPTTSRVLEQLIQAGHVVIDIGANIGAHTLPMAKRVGRNGRVIAFEPTQFAHAKLIRNLELNPELAAAVTVERTFLTDRASATVPSAIYSSWPLKRSDHLHKLHRGAAKDTSGASAVTLDTYIAAHSIENLRLVKLDVDGHECEVLRGANHTLSTHNPIIIMELAPYALREAGESLEELLRILSEAKYQLYEEGSLKLLPMEAKRIAALITGGASINVVAKPCRVDASAH